MKKQKYLKHIITIVMVAGCFIFTACGGGGGGDNSSAPSEDASSLNLQTSNLVDDTYGGQVNAYSASFSYSCNGGLVTGSASLSSSVLTLVGGKLSTCSFTFTSLTYNSSTISCDTTTSVSPTNAGDVTPAEIACGSYLIKVVTSGIYDSNSTVATLYTTLLTASAAAGGTASTTTPKPFVGSGDDYNCALVESVSGGVTTPKIYCWGINSYIFPGNYLVPTQISTSSFTPQSLTVGKELVCTLDSSNNAWCLGSWQQSNIKTSFTQVSGLTNVEQMNAGFESVCALTYSSNNTLQCVGYVDFIADPVTGKGGYGSYQSTPVTIPQSGTFSGPIDRFAISNDSAFGAYGAVCAIIAGATTAQNTVECTGNNVYGQLGTGGADDLAFHSPSPVMINATTPLTGAIRISGENGIYCAVTSTFSVYCWGRINDSPLINMTQTFNYIPGTLNIYHSPGSSSYAKTTFGSAPSMKTIAVREPNFFGFLQVPSGSLNNTQITAGGYIYGNNPALVTAPYTTNAPQYTTSLYYATLMPFTFNNVSVGAETLCGSYNSTVYCYGQNMTNDQSFGSNQMLPMCTEPIWTSLFGQNAICNVGVNALWTKYVYGSFGTLFINSAAGDYFRTTTGFWGDNTVQNSTNALYYYQTSTVGGVISFTSNIVNFGVGSTYTGCRAFTSNNFIHMDPGHLCAITTDGAIFCMGSNDCGQVGNGGYYNSSFLSVGSPTAVLYPSSSSYTGGVAY